MQHQLVPPAPPSGLSPQQQLQLQSGQAGTSGLSSNSSSATVKVRGLPYHASPAQILGLFYGFQYLPDSLQIGLDSLGRPNGEAWLTFVNPSEALRAVCNLNRLYMFNRPLELSLC